eukprot:TRINITY_DN34379_c0_g1_i2.p1 TRINITY_DN34379_c0_g1~~TRINITY_DN34379_c0_g1_i2.p1  ORF type:complete len:302 (-),score=47.92 TRINITY_DN34379_c0_g1_i2:46-915(-)
MQSSNVRQRRKLAPLPSMPVPTRHTPPPPHLANLPYHKVVSYFHLFDRNKDGMLSKDEFCNFVQSVNQDPVANQQNKDAGAFVFEAASRFYSQDDINSMFASVDTTGAGLICIEALVAWLLGGSARGLGGGFPKTPPTTQPLSPLSAKSSGAMSPLSLSPKTPGGKRRNLDKSGSLPNLGFNVDGGDKKQLVLEIVHGSAWGGNANWTKSVELQLSRHFPGQIKAVSIVEGNSKLCHKVTIVVGSGLVLWDRIKMIPFQNDPFANLDAIRDWVAEVTRHQFPLILRSMQ